MYMIDNLPALPLPLLVLLEVDTVHLILPPDANTSYNWKYFKAEFSEKLN